MSDLYPWKTSWNDFAVGRSGEGVYISTVMDTIEMTPTMARELADELRRLADNE